MPKTSAGIVLHRPAPGASEASVLLVHPGGPFWARRDAGAWSIPKGELEAGDDPADVAAREFLEEIGQPLPLGELVPIGEVRQAGGKVVVAFAVAGTIDVSSVTSNTFEMEWPPRSGRMQTFPEVDRAEWFELDEARVKINPAQSAFLDRLPLQL